MHLSSRSSFANSSMILHIFFTPLSSSFSCYTFSASMVFFISSDFLHEKSCIKSPIFPSCARSAVRVLDFDVVKLAAKTVGGKDSAVFVPPASGIVYQTPAMNAPFNARNGGDKRIFSDIRIADLIDKSKNLPPPTKEIEVERLIAESRQSKNARGMPSGEKETETGNIHAEANRADKPYKKTGTAQETYESFPNLFSKEEREAWYKTESFRKTGLSVSDVENLVQSEEEKI